ncbi:MAG: mechanosensitive ion channel family protein [Gammaproteobacteria bacterium]|nr:mechanosensitive ion channel family protein [Gammaproteobacteria bacterium]
MSFSELLEPIKRITDLIGPNVWLQAAIIALVFIIAGKIADFIISGVLGRFTRKTSNEFDDRIVDLVHKPVFMSFVIVGLALATLRLGLPETVTFLTLGILKTIGIFLWYGTLARLMTLTVRAYSAQRDRKIVKTGMISLLHNVMKIILVALAIYFLFLSWNINVTAWVASAGIVGLALSFAAKDTLSNLFAGVSIIMDAPYKEGDYIILESGERGQVTEIGLRSTRILTRDDVEITVPNGIIGNGKIINEAGGPPSQHRIRVAVGIAYGSDIDQVIEVLRGVASDHLEVLANPEPRVRFRTFGDFSLNFELLSWIANPADRGRVSHELNCAVYKALRNNKIEIPFPQRDIHVRTMPASEG